MPEDLPTPEKSIAQIEKEQLAELKRLNRRAKEKPLMLDE
jgi:DNA-damage-inducible protein D